jgi:glutaminyl-peptide cyclotransferase
VPQKVVLLTCVIAALLLWRASLAPAQPSQARQYRYHVIHTYPHDPSAFTQGLEYHDGVLYEGTGLNGRSSVRKEDLATGTVLASTKLNSDYFGEGITVIHRQILELTWQSQMAFVYNQDNLQPVHTFTYTGEGWGLANDGHTLYMSDGSPDIRCLDPDTFAERRRITVHDGPTSIALLNELECVHGEIFANIWHSDRIARIRPTDGTVTGWIDLTGLLPQQDRKGGEAVLNGIAYDAPANRLFVTGKLWPKLFEIELLPE